MEDSKSVTEREQQFIDFLVRRQGSFEGEEKDRALLEKIQHHLKHPVWMLFLGRKAFPPSEPIWIANEKGEPDGIRELPLRESLEKGHPRLRLSNQDDSRARLVLEDAQGDIMRPDQPICFKKPAPPPGAQ